jgi:hypothetical protein
MLRRSLGAGPIAAAALLFLSLAATPSIAQGPPGGPGGAGGGAEALVGQLRAAIRPTAAQQTQFNAVAQVMRENAAAESRIAPPQQQGSAVDQLRTGIQIDQMELDGMRRLLPAMEALYGVLSPQQQRAADSVFQRQQQGPPQR